MSVVSLEQARKARAEQQAAIEADARRIVEVSTDYGQHLATYAQEAAGSIGKFDRDLMHSAERFILRRGLTRSRRAWCKEYGPEAGRHYAKMAEPIVRDAFWAKLDEIDPLTCEVDERAVPLVRGWAHRFGASA